MLLKKAKIFYQIIIIPFAFILILNIKGSSILASDNDNSPEVLNSELALKDIKAKAYQLYENGQYEDAYKLYLRLIDIDPDESNHSSYFYDKAKCEYFMHNYEEAEKTALDPVYTRGYHNDGFLSQIYYDSGQYQKAIVRFYNKGLPQSCFERSTVAEYLAKSYEELAFDALISGDKKTCRLYMEKALRLLKNVQGDPPNYTEKKYSINHRVDFLERKLENYDQIGAPYSKPIQSYSEQDIQVLLKKHLTPEQAAEAPYPFEIDETMRRFVRDYIPSKGSDIQRARKLFRLFQSESILKISAEYGYKRNPGKKEVKFNRTAKEAFYDRKGDCFSKHALFIALAREAGLRAYMVRIFSFLKNEDSYAHNAAGLITEDNRLIIVDLSIYSGFDVPYENYRLLDDKECLSYFINPYDDDELFIEASLNIFPENEQSLFDLASKAIDNGNLERAQEYLDQFPAQAKAYSRYWVLRYKLEKAKGDLKKARESLDQGESCIKCSEIIVYQKALLAKGSGNYLQAIDYFKRAINWSLDNKSNPWEQIALLYQRLNMPDEAIEAYRNATFDTYNANTIDLNVKIAGIYLQQKEYEKAISYYLSALNASPDGKCRHVAERMKKTDSAFIGADMIKIYNRINTSAEIEQAIESLSSYQRMSGYSKLHIIPIILAHLYLRQGKVEKADSVLERIMFSDSLTGSDIRHLLDLYESRGQWEKGLLTIVPRIEVQKQPALLWKELADSCDIHLQYQRAEEFYQKAVDAYGENLDILSAQGRFYLSQGQSEKAEQVFKHALEAMPIESDPIGFLTEFFRGQKVSGHCFELIEALIPKLKSPEHHWFFLGDFAYKSNEYARALKYYQNADGGYKPKNKLYNAMGLLYKDMGKFSRAEDLFLKAAQANSTDVCACRLLGGLYHEQCRWEEANAAYGKAVKLIPLEENTIAEVIVHYNKQGKLEEGFRVIEDVIPNNPNIGELWLTLGEKAYGYENYRRALDYYQKAETLLPEKSNLWQKIALAYNKLQEYEQAKKHFLKSIEAQPKNLDPYLNLAGLYQDQKQWHEANAILRQALESSLLDRELLKYVVSNYDNQGQLVTGYMVIEPYINKAEDAGNLWFEMGFNAESNKLHQRAIDYYSEAEQTYEDRQYLFRHMAYNYKKLKKFDQAEAYYLKALETKNDMTIYYASFLADFYLEQGLTKKANAVYDECLKGLPVNKDMINKVLDNYAKQDALEKGFAVMETQIAQGRKTGEIWYQMGSYAFDKGLYQEALNYYLKAEPSYGEKEDVWGRMAGSYMKLKMFDQAERYYQQMVERQKSSYDTYMMLAKIYQKKKDWDKANVACSQALDSILSGNGYGEKTEEIVNNVLDIFIKEGKPEQGFILLEAAGIKFPEIADDLQLLIGKYAVEKGYYQKGLDYFSKISPQFTKKQQTFIQMGIAYKGLNRHQEAEACFLQSFDMDKNNTHALLKLADLYREQGKWAKADELLKKSFMICLGINPIQVEKRIGGIRIYTENKRIDTINEGLKIYLQDDRLHEGFDEVEFLLRRSENRIGDDVAAWNVLGDFAFNNYFYHHALRYYSNALKIIKEYKPIYYNLIGCCFENIDQLKMAEYYYLLAIEEDKGYYLPYQALLNLYINQRRYQEARQIIDDLYALDKGCWGAYYLYAEYYRRVQADWEKARAMYCKAKKLNENVAILCGLFNISGLAEHKEIANEALGLYPHDPSVYLLKGLVMFEYGRYEEALKYSDKAIEFSPGNAELLEKKLLFLIPVEQSDLIEQCINDYEMVFKRARIYDYVYGRYLYAKGDYAKARIYLEKVPINSFYHAPATSYLALMDIQENLLMKALERMESVDKGFILKWRFLAEIYLLIGKKKEAGEAIKKLEKFYPEESETKILKFYYNYIQANTEDATAMLEQLRDQPFFNERHLRFCSNFSERFIDTLMTAVKHIQENKED
ncbi:MAG: tetratricopeptide repeat protein [Deltaproteobacteria bacterium]|nr:tetratricopeptide repeat protein [Deltaproteobacteria bacterium]